MSWYLVLKFIHVFAAVVWLGGGFALVFAGAMVPAFEAKKAVIETVSFLSNRLFIPALVLVLLSGGTLWWVGALTLDAWVVYGLVGIVLTGVVGATILGPAAERIAGMIRAKAPESELLPQFQKLLRGAQADMVALFTIVFAMVVKPTWADTGLLVAMVLVAAAGAAYFLMRPLKA